MLISIIGMIGIAKSAADPAGHYSRPDVTRLLLNKKPSKRFEHFALPVDSEPVPVAQPTAEHASFPTDEAAAGNPTAASKFGWLDATVVVGSASVRNRSGNYPEPPGRKRHSTKLAEMSGIGPQAYDWEWRIPSVYGVTKRPPSARLFARRASSVTGSLPY